MATTKTATKKVATKTATPKKTPAKEATKKSVEKTEAEFNYFSPDSSIVYVAGTFNNWKMVKMKKDKTGNWKYKAKLPQGEHQYKYVFEGVSWEIDETAPAVTTELGLNNLLIVQ